MAIADKEKELAAVGMSVAAGCKPCTNHHVKAATDVGCSVEEIKHAISIAINVRCQATEIMEAFALARFDKNVQEIEAAEVGNTNRVDILVAIGAAFAVNCTSTLEKHLALAESTGITQDEISRILHLSKFIKGKGASHVERLGGMLKGEAA